MFADEEQAAQRSKAALAKVSRRRFADGRLVHSVATLLADLATVVRNTCRTPTAGDQAPTFPIVTTPNPPQRRALELIERIPL
jgi:hypothetical protein